MKILLISLINCCSLFAISADSVHYDVNANQLKMFMDAPIHTNHVLLGNLSFYDGSGSVYFTGGVVENVNEIDTILEISLIYGSVLDSRTVETIEYSYWGNTNELANAVEELDLNNLQLIIQPNTILGSVYETNTLQTKNAPDFYL